MRNARFAVTISLLAAMAWLQTGCATKKLSAQDRASLQSVSIQRTAQPIEKRMIAFSTSSQRSAMAWSTALGIAGGLVGVLATSIVNAAVASDGRGALTEAIRASGVSPTVVMADAFKQRYQTRPIAPLSAGRGTAEFKFELVSFVVTDAGSERPGLSPLMSVRAELVRNDGKLLWEEQISAVRTDKRFPDADYLTKPAVIREAFEACADRLAENLVASLHGGRMGTASYDPNFVVRQAQDEEWDREDAAEEAREAAEDAEWERQQAVKDAAREKARAEKQRQKEAAKAAKLAKKQAAPR